MKKLAYLASALASMAFSQGASAQLSNTGFAIDRFEPSEHGSEWFALDSVPQFGGPRPAFGFVLDYARKPLVLVDSGDNEVASIVDNQLYGHLGGSIVLNERIRFGLNLPVLLVNTGEGGTLNGVDFQTQQGAGFGDLRFAADYRFFGEPGGEARVSAGLRLYLPTGSQDAFSGDGSPRFTPQAMFAGDRGRIAYAARLGLGFRFRSEGFAGETFGTEVQLGLSAGYRFLDNRALLIGPELLAGPVIGGDGNGRFGNTNPAELLLGAHYDAFDEWRFGLGVGPGLLSGIGSPSFRVLASVEWVAAAELDADHDRIEDRFDACPSVAGRPSQDPALHGCPAIDTDADGITDGEDACPGAAGPPNADPAKHGCPADSDLDTIVDRLDACPADAGPPNQDPAKNGCPMAKIAQGQIVIVEQVQFETGSAQISTASDPLLQAVLKVFTDHPEIDKVSVEGHTDNTGSGELNRTLSRERAAAVVYWLVSHGIDSSRLTSTGFGPDKPLADNATDAGRQMNRRVEFHILPTEPETQP